MIFFLSGTGNTRWVAEQLAAILGDTTVDITTILSDDCSFTLQQGESVGFCFPVHAWRPPLLMRRFLSRLRLTLPDGTPPYCWSVFTQGDAAGLTVQYLQKDLQAMRTPLQAQFFASVSMPNTYIGLPFMDVDDRALAKQKLQNAEQRVRDLARRIQQRETAVYDVAEGKRAWFNSRIIGNGFSKWISDEPFRTTDHCLKCGRCAEVCPVGNIQIQPGQRPEWKHNGLCMNCFSCYHHCPAHAIDFSNRTQKKGQYYFGCEE